MKRTTDTATLNKIKQALDSLQGITEEASASSYTVKEVAASKTDLNNNGKNPAGLQTPVRNLKQVGPQRAKLLERIGVLTIGDLLYHFPRRYEDRSNIKKITQLSAGEIESFFAQVISVEEYRARNKKMSVLKATLADATGQVKAIWFNQPYLKMKLRSGVGVFITGKVSKGYNGTEVVVQDFELSAANELLPPGLVPVYPATEGLPQKLLRQLIFEALNQFQPEMGEQLPPDVVDKYKFIARGEALKAIHFPGDWNSITQAKRRLVYEELFLLQLRLIATNKLREKSKTGIAHTGVCPRVEMFYKNLPFSLTTSQRKVICEILADMESSSPMSRLVQGDVGSGKTVVAMLALLKAVDCGYQGALMAPTEILAEQHFLSMKARIQPLGVKLALLTGSMPKKTKDELLSQIASGEINVVIGTQALIQENVNFKKLSLAVTDEQHRFGVMQRAVLQNKGLNPDILVMTATPIPRTLALTLYGDLDLSIIDELPPGRKPVLTRYVPELKRRDAYGFIKGEIDKGRQAYIVCPLVEESESIEAEAATRLAAYLHNEVFQDYNVGLLHGRMPTAAKEEVMKDFRENKVQILVSTTVIEVGVNVPNATIMLIEGVERFGLAQLHQLRGRIGRGEHKSYCLLMGTLKGEEAKGRVRILTSSNDGFQIAEEDLKLRGPGEFFGTRQHGLPQLKIADLIKDANVLEKARQDALEMIKKYPDLLKKSQALYI